MSAGVRLHVAAPIASNESALITGLLFGSIFAFTVWGSELLSPWYSEPIGFFAALLMIPALSLFVSGWSSAQVPTFERDDDSRRTMSAWKKRVTLFTLPFLGLQALSWTAWFLVK